MTREEYLAKRKAYYQKNKHKWAEYSRLHREELNEKARERRAKNLEVHRERAKRWRDKNKEKISNYQKKYSQSEKGRTTLRKYYEENKEDFFVRAKKSRYAHRDEARCHSIVNKHLEKGKLTKQPCEVCGNTDVDAHHDDYNKPLDVRWLCRVHHAEWHSKNEPIRASNTKQCVLCGKEFYFTHRAQKFCSDECRAKWNKEKAHQYYIKTIAEDVWCASNNLIEEN